MIKAEVDGSGGLSLELVGFSGIEGEAVVGVLGVEAVLSVHSSTTPLRAFFFFVMIEAPSYVNVNHPGRRDVLNSVTRSRTPKQRYE